MEQLQNQLTYKELDGAEPGSRDLITFDFISEQPDILVEPWNTSTSTWGESELNVVQDDGGWMKYDEESYEHVNEQNKTGVNVYHNTLGSGSWKEGEAAGDEVWYSPATPSYELEA